MDPDEIEEGQPERVDTTQDDVLAVMNELAGGAGDDQTQPQGDRPRDERGRFASKGGEEPPASAPQPATRTPPRRGPGTQPGQEAQAPAPQQDQTPAPAVASAHIPQYWKPEYGDFAALPPATQAAIMQRETQIQRFASDAGRRLKEWEPIQQALEPLADHFKQIGGTPQSYLTGCIQVESGVRADATAYRQDQTYIPRLEALEWLAQQYYGADLATLVADRDGSEAAPAQPANGAPPAIEKHPLVQHLLQKVQQLEGGFSAQQQREQDAQAAAEQQRRARVRKEFEAFASDKPLLKAELSAPEGAARPIIEKMQRLLASQAAANFQDAFEQAQWLHPPAREALLKEQRQAQAQRARAAAVSPRAAAPTPGAMRSGTRQETHEESVRAVLEELGA